MTKIHVTQKHIDKGIKNNCLKCPVALALYEYSKMLCDNITVIHQLSILYSNRIEYYHMPKSIIRFIRKFDTNKKVKPFNFVLKLKYISFL